MQLHELLEKRAAAVQAMRSLADTVEAEGRDYSDEEDAKHNKLKAELVELDKRIARARDLQEAERSAPAVVSSVGDGAYESRARDFSIAKAILARCGEPVDDGLERELGQELRNRTGRTFHGIAVPDEVFMEQRTLTVGSGGDAASLYQTAHRPDLFVDLLRSQLVTGRLGATYLDGLVGDQSIPRQIGSSTAQHVAEDGALTETDAEFDDIALTPKTVGALTSFSRRALINATPSVEQLVRRDLAATIAAAIDAQAVAGDGTGNTPTGIINATGVHALSLAGPTWAEVLEFIASIEGADADLGTMGWAMSPAVVKTLRSTLKEAGDAGAGYLMEEPGNLAGYAVATSTAMPADTVVFGAWSQLLIGRWSGIDVLANPFSDSAFARGRVQVRAMADYDVAVRHGEAFAVADDVGAGE